MRGVQNLEQCPFCGSLGVWRQTVDRGLRVTCHCGAQGPLKVSRSDVDAVWNHRADFEVEPKGNQRED